MAHVSRHYSSHWDPAKSTPGGFDATVGHLLAQGVPFALSQHLADEARRHSQQQGPQQRAPHSASGASAAAAAAPPRGAEAGGGGQLELGPRPGYVWVDRRGATLLAGLPVRPPPPAAAPPPPHAAAAALANMSAAERSMQIWRRVSPGMMPGSSRTPQSSSKSAYVPYSPEQLSPLDGTHHLRKTDFSEYVEARERQHVSLKGKS
ncbi:MAG: hypothetical protein J3K34DRAFT_390201 [Monoraphidium minutum]|nr:MAG: hypothetical protein J3K34DRAFT_390201 [Monoraphidium minutum]